jgi:hypothetical protein
MTKNQVLIAISLIVAAMSSLSTALYLSNIDLRQEIARRDTTIDGLLSHNLKMSAELADMETRLIVAGIHPTKKLQYRYWTGISWKGFDSKDEPKLLFKEQQKENPTLILKKDLDGTPHVQWQMPSNPAISAPPPAELLKALEKLHLQLEVIRVKETPPFEFKQFYRAINDDPFMKTRGRLPRLDLQWVMKSGCHNVCPKQDLIQFAAFEKPIGPLPSTNSWTSRPLFFYTEAYSGS